MNVLSNKKFREALANNDDNSQVDNFLAHMDELKLYQNYLTASNFKIYQNYQNICNDLAKVDPNILNPLQQKIVKNFAKSRNNSTLVNFSFTNDNQEGGTTLKYSKPSGFINALLIIGSTISTGLFIAWIFISRF